MTDLRALIVEDSVDDADLLVRELARNGYELVFERVETAHDMEAAIGRQSWDIIFSGWTMPQFSAPDALAIAKRHEMDIPFIIVSGEVGEDAAIEALRSGAHDFVLKEEVKLLVPAIERELREAAMRRERVEMREQVMVADRVASVSLLAAGIAHEINNPLSAVVGNLDLALGTLQRLEREAGRAVGFQDVVEEVRVARDAAAQIRNVANDLKLFARPNSEERVPLNVQRVVESSLRIAHNAISGRAQLKTKFAAVPLVTANESRLGQAFLNLILNVVQSIPEGHIEDNEISIETMRAPDGDVVVEVRDTGSGMTAEVQKSLFEPTFTTKPIGTGTGLGLAICERIIISLGGTIAVESKINVGTVFRVHLIATDNSDEGVEVRETGDIPLAHRGAVLVIDDEPAVGILMQRILENNHAVTRTTSAIEALDWIADGRRYDVILCDLMMPDLNGMDFYAQLQRIAHDQAARVIFVTGGAFTTQARQFMNEVANDRIEKPFDIGDLSDIVDSHVAKLAAATERDT